MTNKLEISRTTLTIAMRLVVRELETLANGSAIQRHKAALEELRAQLNESVTPNVIPAACTHGAYGDDAACMDCLKAWGQWPFKAPGAEQRHAVPDGYCLMPTSLTAENGAKSLLIGEFKVSRELSCDECASSDEESGDCEICGGHGSYNQDTPIGWDLMKEIYHKAVEGLALKPEPSAPKCATCQDNGVIGWTSGQTAESFDMGEYECPDCAPADQPQGGRAVPFSALCYGARFKYTKDEAAEWVKVGHDLIAGWKAENVATTWVGQPLCSFSDDDDVSAVVWLIDEGAGK